MSNRRITEVSTEEFDAIVESFIERQTQDMGEIEAPLFYEALEAIFATETVSETVELEGQVVGSQLQLSPIHDKLPGVSIHDNEIVVNNIAL
jgi:hypothetical protein